MHKKRKGALNQQKGTRKKRERTFPLVAGTHLQRERALPKPGGAFLSVTRALRDEPTPAFEAGRCPGSPGLRQSYRETREPGRSWPELWRLARRSRFRWWSWRRRCAADPAMLRSTACEGGRAGAPSTRGSWAPCGTTPRGGSLGRNHRCPGGGSSPGSGRSPYPHWRPGRIWRGSRPHTPRYGFIRSDGRGQSARAWNRKAFWLAAATVKCKQSDKPRRNHLNPRRGLRRGWQGHPKCGEALAACSGNVAGGGENLARSGENVAAGGGIAAEVEGDVAGRGGDVAGLTVPSPGVAKPPPGLKGLSQSAAILSPASRGESPRFQVAPPLPRERH